MTMLQAEGDSMLKLLNSIPDSWELRFAWSFTCKEFYIRYFKDDKLQAMFCPSENSFLTKTPEADDFIKAFINNPAYEELIEGEYYACECEYDDTEPYLEEDDFDDCC